MADKIAYVDNVWDVVHAFIRIPAGAALAAGTFADFPSPWSDSEILRRVRDKGKPDVAALGAALVPTIWQRDGRNDAANANRFCAADGSQRRSASIANALAPSTNCWHSQKLTALPRRSFSSPGSHSCAMGRRHAPLALAHLIEHDNWLRPSLIAKENATGPPKRPGRLAVIAARVSAHRGMSHSAILVLDQLGVAPRFGKRIYR